MRQWRESLVRLDETILDTMKTLDRTALQIAIVVDEHDRLLGTVTDGDIRRGILKGLPLHGKVDEVMNRTPYFAHAGRDASEYRETLHRHRIKHLPLVDDRHQVRSVFFADEMEVPLRLENTVVLMAGGLGTRLQPLTNDVPKPLLRVGDRPILETIIVQLRQHGYYKFVITVNYHKDMIKSYFQDGSRWDCEITYIDEGTRLGTAGSLSLLKRTPREALLVMNGDLLTKVNFKQLLNFHLENQSAATMCVREYEYQVPFGVIQTMNDRLLSIVEKPVHKSFVNAGIYVLQPDALEQVPYNQFFDMPDLLKSLVDQGREVSVFPLREYWMDIGQMTDFIKANEEYPQLFS